jgi:hypothetical protein
VEELLNTKLIGVEPMEKDDSLFYENLLSAYGTKLDSLDLVVIDEDVTGPQIDELEVLMISASLDNTKVIDLLKDRMKPMSLDDPTLFQRGSFMEALQITYPKAYPFILPKGAFQGLVKEPILTVAIRDLLICHKDLEFEIAYDIVKTTIERKNTISQEDFEFGQISASYEMKNLSFPLHDATISYINRDQPTIFERYAELFGVVFSIVVVLIGAVSSIKRRYSQISKDRIDVYYEKVLEIRKEASVNPSSRNQVIDKLYKLREESYEALILEKVKADESFTILQSLINETMIELNQEVKQAGNSEKE